MLYPALDAITPLLCGKYADIFFGEKSLGEFVYLNILLKETKSQERVVLLVSVDQFYKGNGAENHTNNKKKRKSGVRHKAYPSQQTYVVCSSVYIPTQLTTINISHL